MNAMSRSISTPIDQRLSFPDGEGFGMSYGNYFFPIFSFFFVRESWVE